MPVLRRLREADLPRITQPDARIQAQASPMLPRLSVASRPRRVARHQVPPARGKAKSSYSQVKVLTGGWKPGPCLLGLLVGDTNKAQMSAGLHFRAPHLLTVRPWASHFPRPPPQFPHLKNGVTVAGTHPSSSEG